MISKVWIFLVKKVQITAAERTERVKNLKRYLNWKKKQKRVLIPKTLKK